MGEAASTNLHLHYGAILNVHIQEATIHPTVHYHHSSRSSFQDSAIDLIQAIFAFLATALINFLQLHYQGKPESPFETRPLTMLLAIVSLFIYCLSYDAKLRLLSSTTRITSTTTFDHFMDIFGPLSLVALASVLFSTISCLFLFPGALFYSLCQIFPLISGIRMAWDWLLVALKNRFYDDHEFRQQSTRRSAVSGRISVEIPWISLSENVMRNHVNINIRPPV